MFKTIQQGINNFFKTERKDGWYSPLTNIGAMGSRTNSTMYIREMKLGVETLRAIYHTSIVNLVVEDALRSFIEADKLLLRELSRLKTTQAILEAGCKGRLYGGAMIVAFVEDARGYEKPLNVRGIEKVVSLKVFGRQQIGWEDEDVCINSSKKYFGEPEVFTITPESSCNSFDITKAANNNGIRVLHVWW